jgi:hypothetical protein
VGALLDDTTGTILGSHTTYVSQTLLGDDAVKVVLGMVNV